MKYSLTISFITSLLLSFGIMPLVQAQKNDTTKIRNLEEVLVTGFRSNIQAVKRLDPVHKFW